MSEGRRRGLGRGLDSLIPIDTDASSGDVIMIDVADLEPNPLQPRSAWDDDNLQELANSIAEHGIIQPLIVSRGVQKPFQIIAGERRMRAAQLAGLTEVPALVREVSSVQALELALVENVQRADLNAIEEALAYRQLQVEFDLTQEQISKRVGKSRSAVANAVRLLEAPEPIRLAVVQGHITAGHARALLGLAGSVQQIAALDEVLKDGLSVRQTEELVRSWTEDPQPKSTKRELDPHDEAILEQLQRRLMTKVDMQRTNNGGRVIVHFYTDDDLNHILDQLQIDIN